MAELAAELSEINDLVTAQVEVGMSRDEVLESLYRSWLDRITELKIKPSNAVTTKLSCAIKSTPFNQEQRTNLARAVLSIGCTTAKKKAAARTNQKIHNLENFIPESTWIKLRDPTISRNNRLSLIAQVMGRMRIVNPDQPTLYRGVAISEYCKKNYETGQDEVLQWMDTLQTMVKQQPENRDLDYLISFPVTAADLPNAHQACLGLPLPVDVEIPELDTILGGTKMRGRKPKTCDPPWIASILAQVPDASAHDAIRKSLLANAGGSAGQLDKSPHRDAPKQPLQSPQAPPDEKQSLPQILRFARPQQISKASSESVSSLLTLEEDMFDAIKASRDGRKSAKSVKCKKTKSGDGDDGDGDDDDGDDDDDAFDEIEEEDDKDADDEESEDRVTRKPAAKLRRPAAAAKRPAAAPSTFKRPAAKKTRYTLLKNVFCELRRIGPTISRKRFTSRAYHAAKSAELRKGTTDKDAKEAARSASQKASRLYDELSG